MKEEVLAPGFLDSFPSLSYEGRQPQIEQHRIRPVLDEFKRLREFGAGECAVAGATHALESDSQVG